MNTFFSTHSTVGKLGLATKYKLYISLIYSLLALPNSLRCRLLIRIKPSLQPSTKSLTSLRSLAFLSIPWSPAFVIATIGIASTASACGITTRIYTRRLCCCSSLGSTSCCGRHLSCGCHRGCHCRTSLSGSTCLSCTCLSCTCLGSGCHR